MGPWLRKVRGGTWAERECHEGWERRLTLIVRIGDWLSIVQSNIYKSERNKFVCSRLQQSLTVKREDPQLRFWGRVSSVPRFEWHHWDEKNTQDLAHLSRNLLQTTYRCDLYVWIYPWPTVLCNHGWNHRSFSRSVNHETRLKQRITDEPILLWGVVDCGKSLQLKFVMWWKSQQLNL